MLCVAETHCGCKGEAGATVMGVSRSKCWFHNQEGGLESREEGC